MKRELFILAHKLDVNETSPHKENQGIIMTELETKKYSLLEEPLKEVKINTLFARFVVEKKGKGFVPYLTLPYYRLAL